MDYMRGVFRNVTRAAFRPQDNLPLGLLGAGE